MLGKKAKKIESDAGDVAVKEESLNFKIWPEQAIWARNEQTRLRAARDLAGKTQSSLFARMIEVYQSAKGQVVEDAKVSATGDDLDQTGLSFDPSLLPYISYFIEIWEKEPKDEEFRKWKDRIKTDADARWKRMRRQISINDHGPR